MTLHVIDPSKPVPPTYGNSQHALAMKDGDTAIIMAGVKLEAYGWWANGIYGALGSTVIVDGDVYSHSASGIKIYNGTINVGASSTIKGGDGAIWMSGHRNAQPNILNNSGTLKGGDGDSDGDVDFAAVVIEGGTNIINNSGIISGYGGIQTNGWFDASELLIINNTGTIKGSGWAIMGAYYGKNTITNTGLIDGFIGLGFVDDFYDGRGGVVTDEIFFWEGNDTAFGGAASETFSLGIGVNIADGGGGIDTLVYYDAANVDLRITTKQKTGSASWDTILNFENLSGSDFSDVFIGNAETNVIVGNAGNDTLDGYDGNDIVSGGEGNDLLVGGSGTDTAIFTGKFSDYTIAANREGGVTITDKRASGDGVDVLGGVEFALFSDRLFTLPTSTLDTESDGTVVIKPVEDTGEAVSLPSALQSISTPLTLKGSKKADVLRGGAGDDHLNGGLGRDKLSGGAGEDIFAFTSKLKNNTDTLLDFTSGQDAITLSKAIFSSLKKGSLDKDAFRIGKKAVDSDDRIIFDARKGTLSYDADGSGDMKAVQFAKLKAKAVVAAADFLVV